MRDKAATQSPTTPTTRWTVIGGSVTSEEKAEVQRAWRTAGFKNLSAFVRETVLERTRHINTPRTGGRRAADKAVGDKAA